jgi:hypothetical protein
MSVHVEAQRALAAEHPHLVLGPSAVTAPKLRWPRVAAAARAAPGSRRDRRSFTPSSAPVASSWRGTLTLSRPSPVVGPTAHPWPGTDPMFITLRPLSVTSWRQRSGPSRSRNFPCASGRPHGHHVAHLALGDELLHHPSVSSVCGGGTRWAITSGAGRDAYSMCRPSAAFMAIRARTARAAVLQRRQHHLAVRTATCRCR